MARPTAVAPPPPLASRRARLRPPSQEFLSELYDLAVTEQIPWQWGTSSETGSTFQNSLVDGVLVNFAIEDARDGRGVGFVSAYNANFHHLYCYVTVILHPEFTMRAWPIEGAILFGNYLFVKHNLRHLYLQTTDMHVEQFRSGMGSAFELEARFRDRLLLNGEAHDLLVLTISRERWFETGGPLIERMTRPSPAG
jgi:RimJ/RimL family protein N-acetyltransferase